MLKKWLAILTVCALLLSLAACGKKEEAETTTLTGMIVSIDGTVISLMEMDTASMGNGSQSGRPQMPGGMEGFEGFDPGSMEGFEGFDPKSFGGFGGGNFEGFDPGSMEGFEGFDPESFGGFGGGSFPGFGGGSMPEDMTLPEGMTIPEGGSFPGFAGGNGGMQFGSDAETKTIDIGNAHISLEIEGGKATGSLSDLKAGAFVTITMDGDGEVTNVLVSSSGYGGGRRNGN